MSEPGTTLPAEKINLQQIFSDRFIVFTSVASILSMSASVIYEYSYYNIIGNAYFNTLSPIDYLIMTINWLPIMFFSLVILGCIHLFAAKFGKKPKTEHEVTANTITIMFSWLGVSIISLFKFDVFFLFLLIIIGAYFGKNYILARISLDSYKVLILLVCFIFCIYFWGAQSAIRDLKMESPIYEVSYDGDPSIYKIVILRKTAESIIGKDPATTHLYFLKMEKVKYINSAVQLDRLSPISCKLFNINCLK